VAERELLSLTGLELDGIGQERDVSHDGIVEPGHVHARTPEGLQAGRILDQELIQVLVAARELVELVVSDELPDLEDWHGRSLAEPTDLIECSAPVTILVVARPIEPTPPIVGQDALRLLESLEENVCSPEEMARRVADAKKYLEHMASGGRIALRPRKRARRTR
jgi:hypothetical protein